LVVAGEEVVNLTVDVAMAMHAVVFLEIWWVKQADDHVTGTDLSDDDTGFEGEGVSMLSTEPQRPLRRSSLHH
jgi:hypothetical protein